MSTIQEINSRILAKGNQMASEAKDAIIKIALHSVQATVVQTSKDVPSRPWMLTGSACVVAGIMGAMSSDSKWPYIIGTLGLVSLGVGLSKRNRKKFSAKVHKVSNISFDEEKAFIIDKSNKVLDEIKGEWDSFMESIKKEVQDVVKQSALNDEKKEEFLSFTYYPETLFLSTLPLIDKFNTIDSTNVKAQILLKKSEFANEVSKIIIRTVNQQVLRYNAIII